MKTKSKYKTGIQCPSCKDKIFSNFGHDFKYCSCGYCFVDGGDDYMRFGWGGPDFPVLGVPKNVRMKRETSKGRRGC